MKRPAVDHRRLPSLLLAVCLIAGQLLSLGHHVHHLPGMAGASEATRAADGATAALEPVRSDDTGHAPGDVTCLALAHLLLSGPPGAAMATGRPAGALSIAALPANEAVTADRSWRPSLPRGPPPRTAAIEGAVTAA